jgi:hypothetical protein
MSDEISHTFGLMVPHGNLDACISSLEEGLRALLKTPFHEVLGRDFLRHTDAVAEYMIEFHRSATKKIQVAAHYYEMNGFTINWDQWWFSGFGYKTAGSIWELAWLAYWDAETEEYFTLKGMEPVQRAFADLDRAQHKRPLSVRIAAEIAEHLVTGRFMQLIAGAHEKAKRRYKGLRGLPILATAHDWDTVHQTQ